MANVQLPSFNITPTDINNAGMTELKQQVKSLLNSTIMLTEELTYLLNNLDTRNVNELNAEVIIAGSITSDKIQANAITSDKIQANAITAEKIDVDKLSAISADMGKMTAGQIYGAYISTREYGYPFVELSDTDNMLGAYKDANNSVQIYSPVDKISPVVKWEADGVKIYAFYDPRDNTFSITSSAANINISTNGEVQLFSDNVFVRRWEDIKHYTTGRSLKEDFQYIGPS